MADTDAKSQSPPAPSPAVEVKPDEISLEQIDQLLEADDPEFTQSLAQIKDVGVETEVEIESVVTGDDIITESDDEKPSKRKWLALILRPWQALKNLLTSRWIRFKNFAILFGRQALINARVWPQEFFNYTKANLKVVLGRTKAGIQIVRDMGWPRRLGWMFFILFVASAFVLLKMSVKGIWLPRLGIHVESDLMASSDQTWNLDQSKPLVSLFRAFPQEEIEFLFPKIVVNLKRSKSYQNPMGAFEFYVVLDSQDVALEVQARREELHDRLQRALESQTYNELSSPLGKKRAKDLLRREINEVLTQGWVKDVLIKTMILKQ